MDLRRNNFTPDYTQFVRMIHREQPDRPVLFEHYIEWDVIFAALGDEKVPQDEPSWGWVINMIRGHARLGHDVAPFPMSMLSNFSFKKRREQTDSESISQNADAIITCMADVEAHPWPDVESIDFLSHLEPIVPAVPDGMKLLLFAPRGVFESLVDLLGFDNLCLLSMDSPDLIGHICEEVGRRTLRFIERCIGHDMFCGFFISDDMGYKTSTMLSPPFLREFVLPWHKRYVEAVHNAGKFAILHACGQVDAIMDDIIDDCGFDAKHSFEDVICPVEEIHRRYGERIAILGGFDVDYLARSTPEEINRRATAMLAETQCRGYALGSGNSLTDDMPRENIRALLDAAEAGWQTV
jgi:uroporphyrinogen decarboxylase